MSDMIVYNLVKQQREKLDAIKQKHKEIQEFDLSEEDKKDILYLKNQWNELILDTEKLRTDYDMLIREMKMMKEVTLAISYGKTWKYKLAKWLVK